MTPKIIEQGGWCTLTQLTSHCWQEAGAWRYKALYELRNVGNSHEVKLQVEIRRACEPGDNACFISIFDQTKWNLLYVIPFKDTKAKDFSYQDATESAFRRCVGEDEKELIAIAKRLVF
jgi:hypothetical protein